MPHFVTEADVPSTVDPPGSVRQRKFCSKTYPFGALWNHCWFAAPTVVRSVGQEDGRVAEAVDGGGRQVEHHPEVLDR
jgi:hypothetical protein